MPASSNLPLDRPIESFNDDPKTRGHGGRMKLEFLLCGSPTDAFWSQTAMFRLSLDSLGEIYRKARVVLCVGAEQQVSLPARWEAALRNVEIVWADQDEYRREGDRAQSDLTYRVISDSADLAFNCDADTLLMRPLPDDFMQGLRVSPAICGVIAHYPPPLHVGQTMLPAGISGRDFWNILAQRLLGCPIPLEQRYSLLRESEPCPFYVNYGFVAGTPRLLKELHQQLLILEPRIREILDNDFYGQLGIALGVERGNLPRRVLPMRFNFPNDPIADELYAEELENTVVMHYLRTSQFDRHRIFAEPQAFQRFMDSPLSGSNHKFRE